VNVHKLPVTMLVNGEAVDLAVASHRTLLEVLREDLGLTGTKHGCELGECGACAVLLDGRPVLSCLTLAAECGGAEVTTIEGIDHPLQDAFADCGATQCGYCTPGFIVAAKGLLDENPHPTREEIGEALSGNLCRCTGYVSILDAVEKVAGRSDEGRADVQRGRSFALFGAQDDTGLRAHDETGLRAEHSARRPADE
jgi:carbon-monoxide dehydrogenase small subunit